MVAGNGEFFYLARDGRAGGKHATPISELSNWQDQPPSAGVGSLSVEENRDMITANRILDPWDRIATAVERYLDFLMSSKEEQEKPDERMLTPLEASEILRIHVQTVMAWCREKDPQKKKLHAVKIGGNETNGKGGKWLIPREEIDTYLRRDRLINGTRKGSAK
jgi:hypothetical protein